jgi:predicted nucleic acid-binding protein
VVGQRAPELIRLEVANALATRVRARRIELAHAQRLQELFESLRIEIVSSEPLVPTALAVAVELGVTAHDAPSSSPECPPGPGVH